MIDEKKFMEFMSELEEAGAEHVRFDDLRKFVDEFPKIGGWIPCSERLPETSEYIEFEPTPYMKRIEIAYMTDTVEYLIGFYDGSKWMDKRHNIIKNVIAWKPFLKLPEAYHG